MAARILANAGVSGNGCHRAVSPAHDAFPHARRHKLRVCPDVRRLVLPIALLAVVVLLAYRAPGPHVLARATPPPRTADLPTPEAGRETTEIAEAPVKALPDPRTAKVESALRGVVVDPQGVPTPGVVVHASFGHVGSRHCMTTTLSDGRTTATTDGLGVFALDTPVVSQFVLVNVDAPGWVEPDPRKARRGSGTSVLRVPGGEAWRLATGPPASTDAVIPADARAMGLVTGGNEWPFMRIILERGAGIEGTVETREGVAVPGAVVTARWRDDLPGWRKLSVHADAEGRFSVLVPAPTLLTASEARVTKSGREIVNDPRAWAWPVQPGTAGVRLTLEDPVSVDLLLRGAPVPAEKVWISAKPVGFPGPVEWLYGGRTLCTQPWGGALRAYGLLPGTCEIEADLDKPGCLPAFARAMVPGGPVEITWPRTTVVDGHLEGEDVEGFEVTWTGEGHCEPSLPCRLCEDGEFRVVGTGAGSFYARRGGDPRCAFVEHLELASADIHLKLRIGQRIRGQVEGMPGMRLSALRVHAVAGLLAQWAQVQDDGSFAIVGLPPLAFRVELRSGAWLHDACDNIVAGTDGVRLRVRLPATEPDLE